MRLVFFYISIFLFISRIITVVPYKPLTFSAVLYRGNNNTWKDLYCSYNFNNWAVMKLGEFALLHRFWLEK